MSGSVYKRCSCPAVAIPLDARTGKRRSCSKQHGSWWFHTRGPVDPANGKARRIARGGYRTKRDAEAALAEVVTQLRSGTWTDDEGVKVSAWLKSWLERKQANGLRPATVRLYHQHIVDYLNPTLGSIRLRELRPGHVAEMLDQLLKESGAGGNNLSPNTVTRIHACLRSALGTAVKMRLVSFNAARDVELPKVTRKRVKPWQPAELGAFLDSVQSERLGALFETVAASGMRRGEACGLRWDDLAPKAGVIIVRQQLTERSGDESVCPYCGQNHQGLAFASPKTDSGEYRKIELDRLTAGVLLHHQVQQGLEKAAWGKAYKDHGLVFCREDGNPLSPSNVTQLFHKLTDTVRLQDGSPLRRIRLHDLRHGQASLMLAAGVDMNIISKRLGHARSSFTADTYAHMLDGVGREAAEKAAALIPRRTSGAT